jgi:hypothetical protein
MPAPSDSDLTRLANAAFRRATAKVVKEAMQTGTPLILWVDGEVREVPPEKYLWLLDPDAEPPPASGADQ